MPPREEVKTTTKSADSGKSSNKSEGTLKSRQGRSFDENENSTDSESLKSTDKSKGNGKVPMSDNRIATLYTIDNFVWFQRLPSRL